MQVTGRVLIKSGGQVQPSKAGAKLSYVPSSGIGKREMVTSDRAVEGYKESIEAPTISATFVHSAAISLDALWAVKDQTITFATDTGKSFVMSGGTATKALELGSGDLSVEFGGTGMQEV